jgi:hypothetical protein
MAFNLKNLIEQLDVVAPEIIDLRSCVISSLGNAVVMRGILDRQCENRDQTSCYHCEDQGICSVLTGIAHLELGEIHTAIKELENGNQHFRSKDETWNSIIGLVLLGNAYEKSSNSHQAVIEYKKALHLVTENYIRIHANDYDELSRARSLVNELNTQTTQPFSPRPSTAMHVQADHPGVRPNVNTVGSERAYLSLFSMPICGTVTAGPDGEVHINPVENTFTIVNKIELEGCEFDVFSVGNTATRDRQITLKPQESYAWAKVRGLSMNGWDTPFNENEFVLFREAHSANHNDFVIVSFWDPSGDLMYIVKKYDGSRRQFLSKSTDTIRKYLPIPMDDDHKIIGLVIAIAKPAVK